MTTGLPADPDKIKRAVLGCPAISRLTDGVGTYLPGREVSGVAVREGQPPHVEVHVVAWFGPTMAEIAEQVHAAVHTAAPNVPVTVVIEDIELTGPPARSARTSRSRSSSRSRRVDG